MKFKAIHIHNLNELIPAWALDAYAAGKSLEEIFSSEEGKRFVPNKKSVFSALGFWIEIDALLDPPIIRIATPGESVDCSGWLIIKCHSLVNEKAQIEIPLNPIFKCYPNIQGSHCLYSHAFQTDVPLAYVGVTKRRWFDRYSQHVSSSRGGSRLLFHSALRDHSDKLILHKVFFAELSSDDAMELEEEFVSDIGLYPLGLNMIPGGKAGFEYLGRLGALARSTEERDALVEQLSSRESFKGRPNPLCAALWESDPGFAERVICGHSGRLTVEQVRTIRQSAVLGRTIDAISILVNASSVKQVKNVLEGRTYSRVRDEV